MELTSPFDFVKRSVLAVQDYTHLSLRSLINLFRKPFYMADAIQQADLIGVGSLPIVVLTGMFTGIVLALNTSKTLETVWISFSSPAGRFLFPWCGNSAPCSPA